MKIREHEWKIKEEKEEEEEKKNNNKKKMKKKKLEEEKEEEEEEEEEEDDDEEWQSIKNLINYEAHVFFNAFKLQLNIRDKAFLDVKTDDSSVWHSNDTL